MRFVIDESSWDFSRSPIKEVIDSLEQLAELLEVMHEYAEALMMSTSLYADMPDARSILFNEPGNVLANDRDLRLRLIRQLDRASYWDNDSLQAPWPEPITVGSRSVQLGPSIAWAHLRRSQGNATACLPLSIADIRGCQSVEVDDRVLPVWFVVDTVDRRSFFRDLIAVENLDEDGFEQIASSAFPDLCFVPGVWSGLRSFSRNFRSMREEILHHLAILSDHGRRIFQGPRDRIHAEFGAYGVEISPENGKVLSNKDCMKARTRDFAGKSLEFIWHTKLQRHIDRIHVHEGNDDSSGRIIVGIFRDHLPGPEDF
jgi:hypothetical protein